MIRKYDLKCHKIMNVNNYLKRFKFFSFKESLGLIIQTDRKNSKLKFSKLSICDNINDHERSFENYNNTSTIQKENTMNASINRFFK
jgi:hypothetical protein